MKYFCAALLLLSATQAAAVSHADGLSGAQRALYLDLQRIVAFRETTGWTIDLHELRKAEEAAIHSVCLTPATHRTKLVNYLKARQPASLEDLWLAADKQLSAISDPLRESRVLALLERAVRKAPDACPFWLESDPDFKGRQRLDGQWFLSLGGGGKLITKWRSGEQEVTGGGASRVLLGHSFHGPLSLLSGIEAGANADFPRDEKGNRGGLVFGVDLVAPLVLRYELLNAYLETELGYLAHIVEGVDGVESGAHFGVAVGGRVLRQRWFFPGVVFMLTVERTVASERDPLTMFKAGFRGAIDIPM